MIILSYFGLRIVNTIPARNKTVDEFPKTVNCVVVYARGTHHK